MQDKISVIVAKTLEKLDKLGVEHPTKEEAEMFFIGYPEDMFADMLESYEEWQFEAIILECIAYKHYNEELDKWEGGNNRLYAFDVERFWGDMYGDPLECLNTLFAGEFVISDVKEEFETSEESGIVPIDFKINGKEYHFDAKYNYDWFDTEIFNYVAEFTNSKSTGKHLYMTPVGPQSVLLLYETAEWVAEFERLFWKIEE